MEDYWNLKIDEIKKSFKNNTGYNKWKENVLDPWNKKTHYNEKTYKNSSDMDIKELYTEDDLPDNMDKILGNPGEYPFTRGIHPNMYRGRLWTMRMFSGFGTPDDTNKRLKYLIKNMIGYMKKKCISILI